MQECQNPNSHSPSPVPHSGNPTPGPDTLGQSWVSHAEPQRPDIVTLPEHLQLNRKQRNDSLVAEFQLSLKELGEGRRRKWAPTGLIIPSFVHLTHLPVPTMLGGHADTHPICPLAGEKSWGSFSFLFTHGEWG